jgi:predicted RNA-binding protein YlxR (DUF448 family)
MAKTCVFCRERKANLEYYPAQGIYLCPECKAEYVRAQTEYIKRLFPETWENFKTED